MVLIVEALTPEFGEKFWKFIVDGKYRNKATNGSNPQFYRFDKPEDDNFPKMCIWHIPTAGFAEQNGRNAKLNGRIIFDY